MEYMLKVYFSSGRKEKFKVVHHQINTVIQQLAKGQDGKIAPRIVSAHTQPTIEMQYADGTQFVLMLSNIDYFEIDKEYVKAENQKAKLRTEAEENVRAQIEAEKKKTIPQQLQKFESKPNLKAVEAPKGDSHESEK